MLDGGEVTLQVNSDDVVPVGLGHVEAHLVAQDAGIVDDDVDVAEGVDRLIDEPLAATPRGDVVTVDHGLATVVDDDVDDLLCGVDVATLTLERGADIVDDDLRTLACEQQRLFASDASSSAGDNCHLSVEKSHTPASLDVVTYVS